MGATTFDTLAYSKLLRDAGIAQEQAEALTKAQQLALDEMFAIKEIATKSDILRLENKLDNKIDSVKHELLKWMIGAMIAQTGLLIAIFAFLK